MIRPTKTSIPAPDESCPLEESLRIIAGAWTPKILWYLQNEPRRFGDLKRDLGSISAKVLTARLRELESKGVITRTVMPTSPPTVEYALTSLGRKFHPVLKAIAEVGVEIRERNSRKKFQAFY
jgi:DNA-binding HxlR family transcriptional regulator